MFTQCPTCRKAYPLTKKQWRAKKSKIYCTECKKKFNAHDLIRESSLALISEVEAEYRSGKTVEPTLNNVKPTDVAMFPADISGFLRNRIEEKDKNRKEEIDPPLEQLPWEIVKPPLPVNWLTVCGVGVILLSLQLFYFETPKLIQNADYRPKIEKIARWIGYALPVYENLQEFEVLQSSLNHEADSSYLFEATISNQSAFKQRLPAIKLTLLDVNEQVFAERIFSPGDYLPVTKTSGNHIAPDETIQANLKIAPPVTAIGGFHFDLVY